MNVTANIAGTTDELATVAAALAESAERRRRTGVAAAAELERDKATTPPEQLGAAALLVVDVLAEAELLDRYAAGLRAATASVTPRPPGPNTAAVDALQAAHDAAAAALARTGVPTLQELAAAHNAAQVNGRTAWVAPGVLDDDDLDAEAALELDLQP